MQGQIVNCSGVRISIETGTLSQHRQQQTAQRALARGEKHAPALERPALRNGGLPGLDLSKGHADVPVERLALRRQDQAAVRPGKERAAQLRFQRFDRAGQVRLAVLQQRRRLRQIAAFRGVPPPLSPRLCPMLSRSLPPKARFGR